MFDRVFTTDAEGTTWVDPTTLIPAPPKPRVTIVGASRQPIWNFGDIVGERLVGRVKDHPNFDPETIVYTSRIVKDNEDGTVETNNTIYTLA